MNLLVGTSGCPAVGFSRCAVRGSFSRMSGSSFVNSLSLFFGKEPPPMSRGGIFKTSLYLVPSFLIALSSFGELDDFLQHILSDYFLAPTDLTESSSTSSPSRLEKSSVRDDVSSQSTPCSYMTKLLSRYSLFGAITLFSTLATLMPSANALAFVVLY